MEERKRMQSEIKKIHHKILILPENTYSFLFVTRDVSPKDLRVTDPKAVQKLKDKNIEGRIVYCDDPSKIVLMTKKEIEDLINEKGKEC